MLIEANLQWRYFDSESNLICPWYTLPCLEWLKKQNISEWAVFEYGSGYSSVWWRINCSLLRSIDSNAKWAAAVGADDYEGSSEDAYINASEVMAPIPLWDCIVVDGILRERCVQKAIHVLKSGGYLIIDNYGQEDYNPEINAELLKDWPIQLFKQPNHSQWITAVLQKP